MQKVNVQLYNNFPEIRSSASGKVVFEFYNSQPNTSGKLYTFYSNPCTVGILEPGDTVICQVKNSMTVGVVRAVTVDDVSEREFFHATIERSDKVKNGYRLILAKVEAETLGVQLRFKHLYEKRKLENESAPKIDRDAFEYALDKL